MLLAVLGSHGGWTTLGVAHGLAPVTGLICLQHRRVPWLLSAYTGHSALRARRFDLEGMLVEVNKERTNLATGSPRVRVVRHYQPKDRPCLIQDFFHHQVLCSLLPHLPNRVAKARIGSFSFAVPRRLYDHPTCDTCQKHRRGKGFWNAKRGVTQC